MSPELPSGLHDLFDQIPSDSSLITSVRDLIAHQKRIPPADVSENAIAHYIGYKRTQVERIRKGTARLRKSTRWDILNVLKSDTPPANADYMQRCLEDAFIEEPIHLSLWDELSNKIRSEVRKCDMSGNFILCNHAGQAKYEYPVQMEAPDREHAVKKMRQLVSQALSTSSAASGEIDGHGYFSTMTAVPWKASLKGLMTEHLGDWHHIFRRANIAFCFHAIRTPLVWDNNIENKMSSSVTDLVQSAVERVALDTKPIIDRTYLQWLLTKRNSDEAAAILEERELGPNPRQYSGGIIMTHC